MAQVPALVPELSVIGLVEAGVPNSERIVLRPTQPTQLGAFGVGVGVFDREKVAARLLYDNVFWFPDKIIEPPCWVLLYTGSGEPKDLQYDNGEKGYTFFWQRDKTVFDASFLVPVLVRLGGAVIGPRLE